MAILVTLLTFILIHKDDKQLNAKWLLLALLVFVFLNSNVIRAIRIHLRVCINTI